MDKLAKQRGFDGHLISQACGAVNDNFFRTTFAFFAAVGVSSQVGTQRAALLGLLFMLPMVLLQPLGAFLSDRIRMHIYIRCIRCSECGLVLLGILALALSSFPLMLVAIFLLGAQSALYGPAKYAIIPLLVSEQDLEKANGQIQAFTTIAIISGTLLTAVVDPLNLQLSIFANYSMCSVMAGLALLIAGLGIFSAFRIAPIKAQNPHSTLGSMWNLNSNLAVLRSGYRLVPLIIALSYFWFIGALLIALLPGISVSYGLSQTLYAALSFWILFGIAAGSLCAGRLHVRSYPAAVPCLGAILSSVGLLIAANAALQAGLPAASETLSIFNVMQHSSIAGFSLGLLLTGLGFGLVIVPLNTLLQQRSDEAQRARLFAITGIFGSLGTLLGFALVSVASIYASASLILAASAFACLTVALCTCVMYRHQLAALPMTLLMRLCYKVTVNDAQHIPQQGGCLIICNHVSYADGLILGPNLPRHGKFLVYQKFLQMPVLGFFLRALGVIPIAGDGGRRALVASIDAAVKAAQAGEVVVIFPEGKLSRSGHVDTFQRGMERIASRAGVPIIPAYLDGLHGSIASRAAHKHYIFPRRQVRLQIGAALPTGILAAEARQAVLSLGYEIAQAQADQMRDTLGSAFLKCCKRYPLRDAIIEGEHSLSYLKLAALSKTIIPQFAWQKDETRVGILLPTGRAGAIVNIAAALDGRCAVNLNHTVGHDNLLHMCASAELKTIIISKLYWRHIKIEDLPVKLIFIEDCLQNLSKFKTLTWMLRVLLQPRRSLCKGHSSDIATILFSSGSTGQPKGVQLSHRHIIANGRAICQHLNISHKQHDRILNPLPLFHSFGLNVGFWLCICNHLSSICQVDPRDGAAIGALCQQHRATILISTPTFVRAYMRRIEKDQLSDLRFCVVGSEKCPPDLRQQFHDKYDAELLEGYGCTELSPCVSTNALDSKRDGVHEHGKRPDSIGRALPGLDVFTVHPESKHILPTCSSGLLVVRSPARMHGYLGQDQLTKDSFIHGGYNTGDIGHIDDDGFIFITGRLSRFAKIGGEMVPLDKVQEILQEYAASLNSDCSVAVAAVADPSRGERLIVMHTKLDGDSDQLLHALENQPAIFKPKSKDIYQVDSLPVLGTGKLDLKGIKDLAASLT